VRCPDRKQLSAYVDKELTLSEMQIIDEHLKDCLSCKIEVERFKKMLIRFRDLAKEGLSIPAPLEIVQSGNRLKWAVIAALFVLLLSSAIIIGYSHENTVAKNLNNSEIDFYYKNHSSYIQKPSQSYFSLVSWE